MKTELTHTQEGLLDKNIIDINDETGKYIAMYLREALQRLRAKGSPDIEIHITSPGGDVEIGLDMYDFLCSYKGKKTAIVFAFAHSMAAVILQACEVRNCTRHAKILIHHITRNSISLTTLRNAKELKKAIADMEERQQRLYRILSERTSKTIPQIKKECEKEKPMNAEEALKFGLIDEII